MKPPGGSIPTNLTKQLRTISLLHCTALSNKYFSNPTNIPNKWMTFFNVILRSLNPEMKSEMQKYGHFFYKSRVKCAKIAFLVCLAQLYILRGAHRFLFHWKSTPRHLISKMECRKQFKITFSPYFRLQNFCYKWEWWYIKIIMGYDISYF